MLRDGVPLKFAKGSSFQFLPVEENGAASITNYDFGGS